MIMSDVVMVASIILGLLLGTNALWLLCRGIWLQDTIDASNICKHGLKKSFFYGLVPTVVVIFIAIVVGQHAKQIGKIISPTILCVFIVYSSIGMSGFVTMIGERLLTRQTPYWKTTLVGGSVYSLTCILPILGWFILLPIGLIIGCGTKLRIRGYRKANPGYVVEKKPVQIIEPKNDDTRLA